MKCCLCHRAIVGGWYLHVYQDGMYRPAHRDCMSGAPCQLVRYQPPKRPKKKAATCPRLYGHIGKIMKELKKHEQGTNHPGRCRPVAVTR